MSHTALPWKVVENAHRLIESSVTLDTVANAIVLGNYVKQGMSIKQAIDKAAENAEFIVTAVNAHEALTQRVAALEAALRYAQAHLDELADAWQRGALVSHDGKNGWRSNMNADALVIIRKALEGK